MYEFINICLLISQLSNAGGRLIIASDGIWDALSSDMAAQSCRGLPAELAAKLVVKVMISSGILPILLRNGCPIFSKLFVVFLFPRKL